MFEDEEGEEEETYIMEDLEIDKAWEVDRWAMLNG